MELISLHQVGPLRRPALVAAFEGWVNAGEAGTEAAAVLGRSGVEIADFDSDGLFDYRQNRPVASFRDGRLEEVRYPSLSLRHVETPVRSLLVLSGPEPNWNWQILADDIVELEEELEVVEHLSLGGIPWAVPHTVPVTILRTTTESSTEEGSSDLPEGVLRVPASLMTALESAVADAGVPTLGLWARVPHYVGTVFHAAAQALVEHAARHLGIPAEITDLAVAAADQRAELDEIVEARPEVQAIVRNLEAAITGETPSGEELAAEIERYLRNQDGGPGPS